MPDNLDDMLKEETPPASPADNSQQINNQTPEEVEFNSLSGDSRERFQEMFRRARQAEEERDAFKASMYTPPAAPNSGLAPDQKQALDTLSNFGVATDEKVDAKLNQSFQQLRWELEQQRLAQKYPGENGAPKYDRAVVEDFMRNHSEYLYTPPELVFKAVMYPDEFSQVQPAKKGNSTTLKPTKQIEVSSEITPDNVDEWVRTHSPQEYNERIEEINRAVAGWTRQFNNQGNRV